MLQPLTVFGPSGQPGVPATSLAEEELKPEAGQNKFKLRMAEKNVGAPQVAAHPATQTPVVSVNLLSSTLLIKR